MTHEEVTPFGIAYGGTNRITNMIRVSVGRYRYFHNLGHDRHHPIVTFRTRGTVSYYVPVVTDEFFDIAFVDTRNGNLVEYGDPYYFIMFGDN